jgi:CRP-like cAMP-binding protein
MKTKTWKQRRCPCSGNRRERGRNDEFWGNRKNLKKAVSNGKLPDMSDYDDLLELLRESPAFEGVSGETLAELAEGARLRPCEPGDSLIEQGVRGWDLFVAVDGIFGVYACEQEGGGEKKLNEMGRGRVFGEIGAVSGIPATASVRAITAGAVWVISVRRFHQVMAHSSKLAESILRSMTRYL